MAAHPRKRGKLIHQYILILVVVGVVISVSFFITSTLLAETARQEARQTADVVFDQAEDRVTIFEEDISSLYMNVVQNASVTEFLQAESLAGRWDNLDGFIWVVGSNMRINKSLQNILLYDADDNLVAAKGDVFFPRMDGILMSGLSNFSDRIYDNANGKVYFQVGMPVYIEEGNKGPTRIGAVYLLFDTINLQEIVDGALVNEDSAVGILDKNSTLVVSSGHWNDAYAQEKMSREDDQNLVYVCTVGGTGWRMVSVVPKSSLLSGVSRMQQLNQTTYLIVLVALCLVCGMVYWRVIRPIARQTAFMASFTQNTKQRIEVKENNELGEMSAKMNEMLDSIEELNREKLATQKKYMELEIEKKQTELIAYRSQINPHFLSNTFNCIRGMALYHGEKEIAELSMALTRFFRYSIQKEEMVTVRKVMESLGYYAQIVRYRFNGKHSVEIQASPEVLEEEIPKMLIQPLVENAVFHGLETQLEGGTVCVRAYRQDDFLVVTVEDSGSGMPVETEKTLRDAMEAYDRNGRVPRDTMGIGFLNVYRRIRLFYGQRARFELRNILGTGIRIRMEFPLSRDGEKLREKQE